MTRKDDHRFSLVGFGKDQHDAYDKNVLLIPIGKLKTLRMLRGSLYNLVKIKLNIFVSSPVKSDSHFNCTFLDFFILMIYEEL